MNSLRSPTRASKCPHPPRQEASPGAVGLRAITREAQDGIENALSVPTVVNARFRALKAPVSRVSRKPQARTPGSAEAFEGTPHYADFAIDRRVDAEVVIGSDNLALQDASPLGYFRSLHNVEVPRTFIVW